MNNSPDDKVYSIKDLREKIDALDTELLTILSKRMALIPSVAEYKKEHDVARYQPKREEEVVEHRRAMAEELAVNPDLAEDITRRIIEDAHRIEKKIMGN